MDVYRNYFIKQGYKCNITPQSTNILTYEKPPENNSYQVSVYKHIKKILKKKKNSTVIELGFGNAYKSDKYIIQNSTKYYGIDLPHSVRHAKKKYPAGNWTVGDFNKHLSIPAIHFDVIFSVDVIEHLIKPEVYLESIKRIADKNTLICISTPERDLVRGKNHFGPSPNQLHVREWNKSELIQLLEFFGFEIIQYKLLQDKSKSLRERFYNLRKGINDKNCQLVVCKLK